MANSYTDEIDKAAEYAGTLGKDISGKIISNRNGVRLEVDHHPSTRHAEDARTWEEMDAGAANELCHIIDELVAAVRS